MSALAGLRVLDLSRLLPGGYCTLLLADLGADVIKVEEPGKGDYIRWMPPYASDGQSAPHLLLNRGKRSVTCNLKTEEGRAFLRDLARDADVLVESFRPGVLDRLGVGYDALREINPRLIFVAISGYGADGPYVHKAGHDINYLGYAGVLSITGHPDGGPWQPGVQIGDLGGGGLMAAVAILAALHARERTGEGQFCDISMTDGALSWVSIDAASYVVSGEPPTIGTEKLNGGLAAYGVYRCSDDRYLTVGALERQFFDALCDALGVPEIADWHIDPAKQVELRQRLQDIFASKPRDEWVAVLADLDTCVGPVNDLDEAFHDPGLNARGMVGSVSLSDGTAFPQIGVVPRLLGTPGAAGGLPSALGADTDEVLRSLGRSDEQIAQLRAAGAI